MYTTFRLSIVLLFLAAASLAQSQTGINLGMPLNSTLESESYPSVSGDGKTMILQSTTGEDGQAELVTAQLNGYVWARPEPVPGVKPLTSKTPLSPDYSLSADGNTISFSSPKYGGVGGSDIWFMERTATGWLPAKNPGKPINSLGEEGDPSLSSDGRSIYFVRYSDKKTTGGKPCGKIYVSEKTGNRWKEPTELPAPINKGCECSPRILADNQTLLFSSQRSGGKGGYDFYISRVQENGSWTEPKAVTLINTATDDLYASIPANGDFMYYSAPGKEGADIFKILLPDEFKPKKVLVKEGVVKDNNGKILPSRVVAFDLNKNTIAALYETDFSGAYQIYLPEGSMYDFSISSISNGYTYYSEFIDLSTLPKYAVAKEDTKLSPLTKGSGILLGNMSLDEKGEIEKRSNFELMRIQRLLKDNPSLKVEIGVHKNKVLTDSVAKSDLTEMIIDSIEVQILVDSVITIDSIQAENSQDTTVMAGSKDTIQVKKMIKIAKITYHNDRTQKKANTLVKTLISKGVPAASITAKGYGDSKPLYPQDDPEKLYLNNRIELRVTK